MLLFYGGHIEIDARNRFPNSTNSNAKGSAESDSRSRPTVESVRFIHRYRTPKGFSFPGVRAEIDHRGALNPAQ
jgi:hypothetical protein